MVAFYLPREPSCPFAYFGLLCSYLHTINTSEVPFPATVVPLLLPTVQVVLGVTNLLRLSLLDVYIIKPCMTVQNCLRESLYAIADRRSPWWVARFYVFGLGKFANICAWTSAPGSFCFLNDIQIGIWSMVHICISAFWFRLICFTRRIVVACL